MSGEEFFAKLCPQWATIGSFLLSKMIGYDTAKFIDKSSRYGRETPNQFLRAELTACLRGFSHVDENDMMLYIESVQNMILAAASQSNIVDVCNLCISSLFDSLDIMRQIREEKPVTRTRTITIPEITWPKEFWSYMEERLSFVYKLIQQVHPDDFQQIEQRNVDLLYDLLIQPMDDLTEERYEGRILSEFSIDETWNTFLRSKMNNLMASSKQKDAKKILCDVLQRVKSLRFTPTSADGLTELVMMHQRCTDNDIKKNWGYLIANSARPDLPIDMPMWMKFAKGLRISAKSDKLEYKAIKAAFKAMALRDADVNEEEKVIQLLKSYAKQRQGEKFEKLAMHVCEWLCPAVVTIDALVKTIGDIVLKKPVGPDHNMVVELFALLGKQDARAVCSYIKPFLNNKGEGSVVYYRILREVGKCDETDDVACALSSVAIELYSALSHVETLICGMRVLPIFMKSSIMNQSLQSVMDTVKTKANVKLCIACCEALAEVMALKIPDTDRSIIIEAPIMALGMLTTTTETFDAADVINSVAKFFREWGDEELDDERLCAIDSCVFPYLYMQNDMMATAIRNLYSSNTVLTKPGSLGGFALSRKGCNLKAYIKGNEEWYGKIFNKAAIFWTEMARFNDQTVTDSLMQALFIIAVPGDAAAPFLRVALEYMVNWNFTSIKAMIHVLDFSVWPCLFSEFKRLHTKMNGHPEKNFLTMEMVFVEHRCFNKCSETEIFVNLLDSFLTAKPARSVKEMSREIMKLKIVCSFVRAHPEHIRNISKSSDLIRLVTQRLNVKEIFVTDEEFLFYHTDLLASVLSIVECSDISETINYIMKISEKADIRSAIQSAAGDCISAIYRMNPAGRSVLIRSALSSNRLGVFGNAILNSGVELTRKDLTELFGLAISMFEEDSSIALDIAQKLCGETLLFSSLEMNVKEKILSAVEKCLSIEEVLSFTKLLADSIKFIKRDTKPNLFFLSFLEQNATAEDFQSVMDVMTTLMNMNGDVIAGLAPVVQKIFRENESEVPKFLEKVFQSDNMELIAMISQMAFEVQPDQIGAILMERLELLSTTETDAFWHNMISFDDRSTISAVSAIISLSSSSLGYFKPILPQLVLYGIYSYNNENTRVPRLINSVLKQFGVKGFGSELGPDQYKKIYKAFREKLPDVCDAFDALLFPAQLREWFIPCLSAITPLIPAVSLKPLVTVVKDSIQNNDVRMFLCTIPLLCSRMPEFASPEEICDCLQEITQFMVDIGDPRIMLTLANNVQMLVKENSCRMLNTRLVLRAALSVLTQVESLSDELYDATVKYLGHAVHFTENEAIIANTETVLRDLKLMSGFSTIMKRTEHIAAHARENLDTQALQTLLWFMIIMASSTVIQDHVFRQNLCNFMKQFKNDSELIGGIEEVSEFLTSCSCCSEQDISNTYAEILAGIVKTKKGLAPESFGLAKMFGHTLLLHDKDTNRYIKIYSEYRVPQWVSMQGFARVKEREMGEHPKPNYFSGGYVSEWHRLIRDMIDPRSGVALIRYGDGEIDIVHGKPIRRKSQAWKVDGLIYNGGDCFLRRSLRIALSGFHGHNFYYGIHDYKGFKIYLSSVNQTADKVVGATMFSDCNYDRTLGIFRQLFVREFGEILLFCNDQAVPDDQLPWAKQVIRFPGNCVSWFEEHGEKAIDDAVKIARNTSNRLFLVAIGPLSGVLIYRMYEANRNNRYIDVGSSIDYILKGKMTRPFHDRKSGARTFIRLRWGTDEKGVPADIKHLRWFYDTGIAP